MSCQMRIFPSQSKINQGTLIVRNNYNSQKNNPANTVYPNNAKKNETNNRPLVSRPAPTWKVQSLGIKTIKSYAGGCGCGG